MRDHTRIVILHWNDVLKFQKIKGNNDVCLRFGKLFTESTNLIDA